MRIYYKPIRVRLWLVYKITRNNCSSQFFANFIRTQKYLSYLFRQNQYSNLKIEAVIWRCSVKKVFRNFTKFTGKHLCQSLFFNKVAGRRTAFLLKKRLWHRCFCETSKNTFLHGTPLVAASVKTTCHPTKYFLIN